jgi:hypothetical protein
MPICSAHAHRPFLADWLRAFGQHGGLLVLRAEQMLDAPAVHRPRLLRFLGLATAPPPGSAIAKDGPPAYMVMHAATLRSYDARPMHNHTRMALDAFYRPHSRRLGEMLGWEDAATFWRESRAPSPEHFSQSAGVLYRRYGPHFPASQRTRYHRHRHSPAAASRRSRGPRKRVSS